MVNTFSCASVTKLSSKIKRTSSVNRDLTQAMSSYNTIIICLIQEYPPHTAATRFAIAVRCQMLHFVECRGCIFATLSGNNLSAFRFFLLR